MPQLSVVVPSVNGFEDLRGCLGALDLQRTDVDLEVVVIDRLGEALRAQVRQAYPWVRVVEVPPGTTIPSMREIGIGNSSALAVGVLEDHVIVRAGWARKMLDGLDEGAEVVGGPIENAATDTIMDWASFLCEYSACLPPLPGGEVDWLPGNNVVYTRRVLDAQAAVIAEHGWENRLHDAIRASGTALVCLPDAIVDHKKHFTFGEYVTLRYHYSRSFAGARVDGIPMVKRLAYGAGSVVLPPLLFYRTVSRIRSKGRHTERLPASLPFIALFVIAWAWGEMVGYLAGAGNSLSKVT